MMELSCCVGIETLIGLYRVSRAQDCWKEDISMPTYLLTNHMSRNRFEQIRCCLHVADQTNEICGHEKMEPVASNLKVKCKTQYVPTS